jgi:hypothetical protein
VSVLETIIGNRRPKFDSYKPILDLLQKFMIESKSQSPLRKFTPPQQAVLTMYTYGALIYLSEVHEVPEQEHILVLGAYLQRQGLSDKQSVVEAKIIVEQAKDPNMHWSKEIGYNSSMYWHKGEDTNATKALARLLKTTR